MLGHSRRFNFFIFLEDNFDDINKVPSSSKEIRCLSNKESIIGDKSIPLSTSNLSSSFDSDHGTIWEEIKIERISISVNGHLPSHLLITC